MKILTIAIPTYNRPFEVMSRLKELSRIDSFNKQKIEVLVCDNGSNIFDMSKTHGYNLEIHHYLQKTNVGFGKNVESCISLAEGKYVWLLGDDDEIVYQYIEGLINYLENRDLDYLILADPVRLPNGMKHLPNYEAGSEWRAIVFISSSIINAKLAREKIEFVKDIDCNNTYQQVLIAILILDSTSNFVFLENKYVVDTHTPKNYTYKASFDVHIRDFMNLERQLIELAHSGASLSKLSRFINAKLIKHTSKLIFSFEKRSEFFYFLRSLLYFKSLLFISPKRTLSSIYALSFFAFALINVKLSQIIWLALLKVPFIGRIVERGNLFPTNIKRYFDESDGSSSGYGE